MRKTPCDGFVSVWRLLGQSFSETGPTAKRIPILPWLGNLRTSLPGKSDHPLACRGCIGEKCFDLGNELVAAPFFVLAGFEGEPVTLRQTRIATPHTEKTSPSRLGLRPPGNTSPECLSSRMKSTIAGVSTEASRQNGRKLQRKFHFQGLLLTDSNLTRAATPPAPSTTDRASRSARATSATNAAIPLRFAGVPHARSLTPLRSAANALARPRWLPRSPRL